MRLVSDIAEMARMFVGDQSAVVDRLDLRREQERGMLRNVGYCAVNLAHQDQPDGFPDEDRVLAIKGIFYELGEDVPDLYPL